MAAAGQRSALLASMLANLAGVGASLLFVYICKTLIDIATGNSGRDLAGWSLAMVATMAAQTLFSLLRTRLAAQTDIRIKNNLRMQIFSRLICAYHGSRSERHSGDITNRLEEDVRVVSECLSNSLPALLSATVQFIAAFCFLMALNNTLAWSVVGIMPLAIILSKIFFRKLRRLTRDIRDTDSLVQSHLQENLQHATLIQTLEQEGRASSGLDRLQSGLYDSVMRRTRFTIVSRTVISLAFAAGYATAFLWGVNGLLAGAVTFGTMTAFLQLVGQIQRPVLELSSYIPSAIHAAASADRLMEIEGDESCAASEPVHLGSPAGIRMEHVSFAYPDGTRKVIDDFSHDFLPGSRTAIVGETGAGKSTLIRLILALLRPQSGSIVIYGPRSSSEVSAATRCNLTYVPQGNSLLSGTVRDNLLLGDPEADEAGMKEALRVAAADFVFQLPDGLDTPCSENGGGLSEGQAQRIAIARALLRRGSILLLDEFSSSLDPETEKRLMENLSSALPGRTMIFITHRRKITEYCSDIIELAPVCAGKTREAGNPQRYEP
ncbi:MAG TPA: ABC transporter ATP-binding protein [Candidatus Cryptobacteroides excrementigallinarum]|nr:ABC transporter ATP-binding protein [Candidatus Cryptobacteroides excrementigallinarum]